MIVLRLLHGVQYSRTSTGKTPHAATSLAVRAAPSMCMDCKGCRAGCLMTSADLLACHTDQLCLRRLPALFVMLLCAVGPAC